MVTFFSNFFFHPFTFTGKEVGSNFFFAIHTNIHSLNELSIGTGGMSSRRVDATSEKMQSFPVFPRTILINKKLDLP
jgi:hypothetical protein